MIAHGIKTRQSGLRRPGTLEAAAGYVFFLPHILLFALFFIIPFVFGVYASLTDWLIIRAPEFIGLKNFQTILFSPGSIYFREFWNGVRNTLIYVVLAVPLLIALPLWIAILLNERPPCWRLFQAIFYIPSLLSVSTISLTWIYMFDNRIGFLNRLLGTALPWLAQQPYAWIAIVCASVWWAIGGNMIIYLAGLSGIPQEQYEAAEMDGANALQQFRHVTLPGMVNPLLFTLVMTTIGSFNVYGQPLIMTGGGPGDETTKVLMMYIVEYAFGRYPQAGLASAMAIVMGLIIAVFSVIQFRLVRKGDGT